MHVLIAAVLLLTLCPLADAANRKPLSNAPFPQGLIVGRHTFFDFGPPFDFYEIFTVQPADAGLLVERLTVTPSGISCAQSASVEVAAAAIHASLPDLLGGRNPCSIPAGDLQREQKRCKKCLTFSGANVTMQAACGGQTRRIRMDVLDRDMFDPAPRTPQHTSWTMSVLDRLESAVGPGVMSRPMFSEPPSGASLPASSPGSGSLAAAASGAFDSLFGNAPHKVSELYAQSQKPRAVPTVEVLGSPPFRPASYDLPPYPVLARQAGIEGDVRFRVTVAAGGAVSNVAFVVGHPVLRPAVEQAAGKWRFPPEAAGQTIEFVIGFRTNCPAPRQP